jgi:hypothetical protein
MQSRVGGAGLNSLVRYSNQPVAQDSTAYRHQGQTSVPKAGFEPAVQCTSGEGHASNRAAAG